MPIHFPDAGGPRATFEGRCVAEEGDALLDWLRRTPDAEADLLACCDIHTALAQLLVAGRVRLAAVPADPILAACLAAAMPLLVLTEPPNPKRRARKPGRKTRP
jgi:hypothetical protein